MNTVTKRNVLLAFAIFSSAGCLMLAAGLVLYIQRLPSDTIGVMLFLLCSILFGIMSVMCFIRSSIVYSYSCRELKQMKLKATTILSVFILFIVLQSSFFLNVTFAHTFSFNTLLILRISFILIVFFTWLILRRYRKVAQSSVAFVLFSITLGYFIVSFFSADVLKIKLDSAQGLAMAKFVESIIISAVVIFCLLAGKEKYENIYLGFGRVLTGLIIGITTFVVLATVAYLVNRGEINKDLLVSNLGWIGLFVFSNAFMEELLFRGILLKPLMKFINPLLTILLTSLVFSLTHISITYLSQTLIFAGIVFLLGMTWGWITYYTRSIMASVLFHAGADLLIIVPIFSSFGIST